MLLKHSAETGVANGTAVTTANSTAGDGSTAFTAASGTALTYSATAFRGSQGFAVVTSSGTHYAGWTSPGGATTAAAVRLYARFNNTDANDQPFLYVRSSGGGTGFFNLMWTSTGKIKVNGDTAGNLGSTSGTLSTGVWYRIEAGFTTATTTTGTLTLRVYAGNDTTTPLASLDLNNVNLGSGNVGSIRLGRTASVGGTFNANFDDLALSTGSPALIGPEITNTAPVANAGPDQSNIEPWSTVTLDGSASTDDAAITAWQWTQTGGTAVTINNDNSAVATFEAPATLAGDTLTFQLKVTDGGALTSTDSVSIAVLLATERAVIGGVQVPMRIIDI